MKPNRLTIVLAVIAATTLAACQECDRFAQVDAAVKIAAGVGANFIPPPERAKFDSAVRLYGEAAQAALDACAAGGGAASVQAAVNHAAALAVAVLDIYQRFRPRPVAGARDTTPDLSKQLEQARRLAKWAPR